VKNSTQATENVAYHAARLVLLISYCGKPRGSRATTTPAIAGRTLLAKLDFFLRYPSYLKRASKILRRNLSDEDVGLESESAGDSVEFLLQAVPLCRRRREPAFQGSVDSVRPSLRNIVARAFVEKLFAIHAAYEKNRADGKVRHYYDVYQLADTAETKAFIGTQEYRDAYLDAETYSRAHWPEAALPNGGSFADSPALSPDEEGRQALEKNYAKEGGLFFSEPPTIGVILARIQDILPKL
jgi:hypothetical protein